MQNILIYDNGVIKAKSSSAILDSKLLSNSYSVSISDN